MARSFNKIYAMKKYNEARIKKLVPDMENRSGIYVWYRQSNKFYAGQSIKLIDRSIAHLMQYDHLGLSIKKHGLYDKEKNPFGWRLAYYYCDEKELNEKERETIAKWNEHNDAYNITNGGQNSGKYDINERQQPKSYRDGIKVGYANCLKDIKEYFEKYLDYTTKSTNECFKKDGTIKEIYLRKYNEFKGIMENGKKQEETDNT